MLQSGVAQMNAQASMHVLEGSNSDTGSPDPTWGHLQQNAFHPWLAIACTPFSAVYIFYPYRYPTNFERCPLMMTGTSSMKMKTRSCKTPQCAPLAIGSRLPTRLTIGLLQYFERKHDVILFAIDCSRSMLALHEDPKYENTKTSRLLTALDAAVQIQKRKVVVGPYDSVGIMLYNTVSVHARNAALSLETTWPS
jgi:hypothetical protein